MVHVGLLARLEARPGKEAEVAQLLTSALALANAEPATTVWFALQLGHRTFGIFDAFPDEAGRQAHLAGQIAAALMAKAPELLSEPPVIERADVLAAKIRHEGASDDTAKGTKASSTHGEARSASRY